MGGGFFDDMWDAYSGAYAYPPVQPMTQFYGPRVPVYGAVPRDRASDEVEEPKEKKKKTVKIIPVGDGDAPVSQVLVEPVVISRFQSDDAAATKIQAVFRGYVVRKTKPLRDLRVIQKVNEELEPFKNNLQRPEQMLKLRNEPKERLRWTEGVMALLLRLDSLQGVHPEVRLIRRALTKELIRLQETIDWMSTEGSEHSDVIVTEDNNLMKEEAEVIDFAVLDGMEFGESDPEESNDLGQNFASGGADEVRESDIEFPMEVQMKERALTMNRALPVEEHELKLTGLLSPDVKALNQEAPPADVSGESSPSRDDISEPISEECVSVTRATNDAEMCEQATVTGRGEEVGRPAVDTFQSGDTRQENASECRDEGEGFTNPASDSMLLEPPCLQAGQPQPSSDGLSDHALLLQVLEENRKLEDVVGKMLQWGKRQCDVIHNLRSRIEYLEKLEPLPELLPGLESDGRKKYGRRSRKGRKSRKSTYNEDDLPDSRLDLFW